MALGRFRGNDFNQYILDKSNNHIHHFTHLSRFFAARKYRSLSAKKQAYTSVYKGDYIELLHLAYKTHKAISAFISDVIATENI